MLQIYAKKPARLSFSIIVTDNFILANEVACGTYEYGAVGHFYETVDIF